MTIDVIVTIIGLVTAVIGFVFEYRKIINKRSREEMYYKKILRLF